MFQAGIILDNGVKTTQANDKDKRPFLSLVGARSETPHSITKNVELQAEVSSHPVWLNVNGSTIFNHVVFLLMFCNWQMFGIECNVEQLPQQGVSHPILLKQKWDYLHWNQVKLKYKLWFAVNPMLSAWKNQCVLLVSKNSIWIHPSSHSLLIFQRCSSILCRLTGKRSKETCNGKKSWLERQKKLG